MMADQLKLDQIKIMVSDLPSMVADYAKQDPLLMEILWSRLWGIRRVILDGQLREGVVVKHERQEP